jgi:hypothetical protein
MISSGESSSSFGARATYSTTTLAARSPVQGKRARRREKPAQQKHQKTQTNTQKTKNPIKKQKQTHMQDVKHNKP